MRKYDYFWMSKEEWYHIDTYGHFVVNEDAPPEAQESYQRYLEQKKRAAQRIAAGESMD